MTDDQLRDKVAGQLRWKFEPPKDPDSPGYWHRDGERLGWMVHPVPHPDDENCMGWCDKRIREAGWEWVKEEQDEQKWWAAFPKDWDGEEYPTVPATNNPARDMLTLLSRILEAK